MSETVVITGAFSYTGKYATRILLERGYGVRTLTNHPPVTGKVKSPTLTAKSAAWMGHATQDQNPHFSQNRGEVGHPAEVR